MSVLNQVHNKFQVFVGKSISEVADEVASFTEGGTIAAKSIGIEFVEHSGQFLLSLGYAEGQEGYSVSLTEEVAGTLPTDETASGLAAALEAAAEKAGDVICHELYVDADSVVHMVFLSRA